MNALQWVGFLSILACSAAIVVVAGKRSPQRAVTPAATTLPAGGRPA